MHRTFSAVLLIVLLVWTAAAPVPARADGQDGAPGPRTSTPIKHLVVIFDENNSFDHYFGTYPHALNLPGESPFYADPDTPYVNGFTPALLGHNLNPANPFRLDPSQAQTCDNNNHYTTEQQAFNGGLMNMFNLTSATQASCSATPTYFWAPNLSMGYYDGNTVTALWNYAQQFAMSDNFFDTEFGTTVMGHLNLISGQTHGAMVQGSPAATTSQINNGSVIANVQPYLDDCPGSGPEVIMTGRNIGDLLTGANITWGWFYGDFAATAISGGVATCQALYNSHYDPFQYYQSTSNPHHFPPSSTAAIGTNRDQANHQYDLSSFWAALANGNLPAVSFLKASVTETGHPSDSTPLEEQTFLVNTINELEQSPFWHDMAIVIAWDDSDGWYDHVMPPIVNPSNDPANDALLGPSGLCGTPAPGAYNDRCGYGERLPFFVISPYAKHNYVDHSLNDTTSVLRFIESNWGLPSIGDQSFDALGGSIMGMFDFDQNRGSENRPLFLDPSTGRK